MKLKTKAWLISQSILLITALIIQLTFYREIKVGPLLGMPKRDYWDIIRDVDPEVPTFVREKQLPSELWDPRSNLTEAQIIKANLGGHHRAFRREDGLRTAFYGGLMVNFLYLVGFHVLAWYFKKSVRRNS
jgi:hypothetical protein